MAALLDSLPQKPAAYVQRPSKLIRLNNVALEAIFGPTIKAIEELVEDQIAANSALGNKPFDYLFLVGGFGSSQLLFKHLEKQFTGVGKPNAVQRVIQPATPGMAVISGAVLLGKNPALIRTRKARATYGIGATVPFVEGVHREDKKVTLADKAGNWCKDVLDKFVCKGGEVEVDEVVVSV